MPLEPGADSEKADLPRVWSWISREKALAIIRGAARVRVEILVALLVFGGVWFSVSLVDRFLGSSYLSASGLFLISGPPVTTAVALLFYIASLAVVALSVLVAPIRQRFFRIESFPPDAPALPHNWVGRFRALLPLKPIDWLAVLASNIGILGLRFALYPFPQGADTPQYLQAANSILFRFDWNLLVQLHAVGIGRWLTVIAITVLRVMLLPVPGQSELVTMMVLPILLGVFYSWSIGVFIHRLMGDRSLAIWGAILAPISFLTIDLSYGLFAQFLGQSLAILALTGFLAFVLHERGNARTTAAMFSIALLAHIWTWAVFAAISFVFLAWALLADSVGRGAKVKRALLTLGPSILLGALLTTVVSNVQVAALYPYSVGDAHPFTLPEGWLWIGGWESAVVWALGLVGLFVLAARAPGSVARVPLLLWTATISAAVFVTGFRDSYRFFIMYPMPILVVLGMRHAAAKLRVPLRRVEPNDVPGRVSRAMPAIALILVLLGSVLPWAYIPDWQYFPGDAGYRQLVEIRDHYGYGNARLIILIDQRYYERALTWASAVTGAQVYPGNLLSLLRGDPYRRDLHRWFPPDMGGVTEILLPSSLYSPDSMEMGLLASANAPGVPYYRVAMAFNASSFLTAAALPLSNSFWTNWTLQTASLGSMLSTTSSQINWTVPSQTSSMAFRSVSYIRPLPNRSAESLYVVLSGSLTGTEGALEVDYQSGRAVTYTFDRIFSDPLLIRMRLSTSEIPTQIKVTFWVASGKAIDTSWLRVGYMGLLSP
jgi:hypothetical protein